MLQAGASVVVVAAVVISAQRRCRHVPSADGPGRPVDVLDRLVPLIVPPVELIVPAVLLIDLASPSTDWASVITWASLPSSGLALLRG